MKTLRIVWQRLVDPDGQTCPRCASTLDELKEAMATLEKSLAPLGIRPNLETRKIGISAFQGDPSQSNRIWIADKPLESWLGAEVSSSPCCSVCGDAECRTVDLGDQSIEVIPSNLIIRAALLAASELVVPTDLADEVECGSG